jgi:3-deoxy-manno-octulosonate cytidylyltransferase (CMP-KDO synthetase)
MSKWLILVPARIGSSRFPGKPLAKIHHKPMIHYVVQNCINSGFDYAIVTDDDQIEASVKEINGNVVRVDDDVPSGSERIALAYKKYFIDKDYEFIVNVQGDEPLLKGKLIQQIGLAHEKYSYDIMTAIKKRSSNDEDFTNRNIVKAVFCESSAQCLYFSRQSIPFAREAKEFPWYQHIGIYCYRKDALLKFVEYPMSPLENLEKLEQLRALESGLTIGATKVDVNLVGVDTPEDLVRIENEFTEEELSSGEISE